MEGALLHLDYCLTPTHRIGNAAIVVDEGRIRAVGGFSAFADVENYRVIELPQYYAAPGFMDTHLYGAGGYDSMRADAGANMAVMSRMLARHGVTSFLPTTQSAEHDHLIGVVKALADCCENGEQLPGAAPVGIHVEGPFLSGAKHGAHPLRLIRALDLQEAETILDAGRGKIRIFTFAPELDGAVDLIHMLLQRGVVPALGHTVASEEQVTCAVNEGAVRCSHLYNGMEPLRQRELGLAGIAMTDDRIWVELIPDGVHIHPGMIDLACRCKVRGRIVCISNSNEAAGLRDGTFRLGDGVIKVQNGRAVVEGEDVLAGGINCLDENYRYFLASSHLSHGDALACFTSNAAKSIGITDRGEIRPGKRADLVVLNARHEVQLTIVGGRVVYCADGIDIPLDV